MCAGLESRLIFITDREEDVLYLESPVPGSWDAESMLRQCCGDNWRSLLDAGFQAQCGCATVIFFLFYTQKAQCRAVGMLSLSCDKCCCDNLEVLAGRRVFGTMWMCWSEVF